MILENRNVIVNESDGECFSSSEMRISQNVHGHIVSMLTERTYKDPLGSIVRELTSNAVDSHRVAKNDSPVIVRLERNSSNRYELRVIDEGIGLNEEDFYKFIGGVGESDKQHTNDLIGCYGLGSKSPLSYCDSYSFICRKNGIERRFTVIKSNPLPKLEKVYEAINDQKNGVTVIIPIKDGDVYTVTSKMKQQLAYFPNVFFDNKVYTIPNNFSIYRDEEFQWSELCNDSYMHLTLDDVYYPLSFSSICIDHAIPLPVALKFKLSDGLFPIPGREELIYNDETKKLILDKLKKVCSWFVEKYNQSLVPYTDFVKMFPYIDHRDKAVLVNGKGFRINDILVYSDVRAEDISMEGVSLRKIGFYKSQWTSMLSEYDSVAYLNWKGSWVTKANRIPYCATQIMKNGGKVVEVTNDESFAGKWKKYLKFKYTNNVVFVKKREEKSLKDYIRLISLNSIPKERWRDHIKEYQLVEGTLRKYIIQELDNTKIPQDWLDKEAAANKKKYSESLYQGLNKQKGDITLSVGRKSLRGGVTYDKKAISISKLHQEPALHIYFNEKEAKTKKDFIDKLVPLISNKLKIVIISEREIKKLSKIHNFVTMDEFTKTKPFARMVTAYLINNELEKIPKSNWHIVEDCIASLKDIIVKLTLYKNKHYNTYIDEDVMENLLPVADAYNLYDHEIYSDYLKLKEAIKEFGFVGVFNGRSKDIEKNVIYTVMLFKKLHRNQFDGYELVKKQEIKKLEEPEFDLKGEVTEDDFDDEDEPEDEVYWEERFEKEIAEAGLVAQN